MDQNLYRTAFRWRLGRSVAAVVSEALLTWVRNSSVQRGVGEKTYPLAAAVYVSGPWAAPGASEPEVGGRVTGS